MTDLFSTNVDYNNKLKYEEHTLMQKLGVPVRSTLLYDFVFHLSFVSHFISPAMPREETNSHKDLSHKMTPIMSGTKNRAWIYQTE